jgi:hypothetical protein
MTGNCLSSTRQESICPHQIRNYLSTTGQETIRSVPDKKLPCGVWLDSSWLAGVLLDSSLLEGMGVESTSSEGREDVTFFSSGIRLDSVPNCDGWLDSLPAVLVDARVDSVLSSGGWVDSPLSISGWLDSTRSIRTVPNLPIFWMSRMKPSASSMVLVGQESSAANNLFLSTQLLS